MADVASDEWKVGDIEFSSFLGMQYNNEAVIPDKAVEEGSFISANKWQTPYNVTIDIAKIGDISDLMQFLEALEEQLASTELIEVVTPAKSFTDGNVYALDYSWNNDEHGPRMIIAHVSIKEVRFVGGSQDTSSEAVGGAKSPENNSASNGGKVQAQEKKSSHLHNMFGGG